MVLALVLAGCASPAPAPAAVPSRTPSATPTPTPEAAPEPATAVIGAHAITVLDENGDTLGELPFTQSGPAAVEYLSALFDAPPEITHRESDFNCVAAANLAAWGEYFTLTYDIEGWTVAGHPIMAHARARAAANGVTLQTASGFGVGDSVDALVASQPGVAVESMDWEGNSYAFVHYDVGAGVHLSSDDPNYDREPYWGASAQSVDGVIESMHAPQTFVDQC